MALAALLLASPAAAHPHTEHGNVTIVYPDQADMGIFALVEATAPGTVPNGLFYYTVDGVQGGDRFTLTADNSQDPFVCGNCPRECPGPDWSPEGLVSGEDRLDEVWLFCPNWPDFDVKFTNGTYGNGPGGEAGTVPGDGAAVVTLFIGDPGEGFTYLES